MYHSFPFCLSRTTETNSAIFNSALFSDLKKAALENMAKLEAAGMVKRPNQYQDMLNAIAVDIRNKHRKRVQRAHDLKNIRQTLKNLEEKTEYLDEQKKSYTDYVNTCINQLSSKKGKKKTVLPFTKQWSHLRALQKAGTMPKFGSYKYSAENLHERGILVSVEGYNPKQFDKITLTISSDEAGVFTIEASLLGVRLPGAEMELRLDDLLQYQFDNIQVISLFDGVAKCNVNLLVHLINKK